MVTMTSICCVSGCPNDAIPGTGRCHEHRPVPFDTSTYRQRRAIPDNLRRRILARDHHRCAICGQPANVVDHIVPRALGGTDDPAQLQSLCTRCSRRKTSLEANQIRNASRAQTPAQASPARDPRR